jgi:hypothetical protein
VNRSTWIGAAALAALLGCSSSAGDAGGASPAPTDPSSPAAAPEPSEPQSTPSGMPSAPRPDAGAPLAPDARSADDGRGADLARGDATPAPPIAPAGPAHAVVAVGYGGVRALSLDDGATWTVTAETAPNGGDDMNLLRAVAYGAGLWVAGGWNKFFTSPDGRTWTERPHKMGIIQGMAFGSAMFLATDINGAVYRSPDGLAWTRVGAAGVGKHTEIVFAPPLGLFAATGDDHVVTTSKDGAQWTPLPGLTSVAYCGGDSFRASASCYGNSTGTWNDGVWIRSVWKGQLFRSSDGTKWTRVFNYASNAFDQIAFGVAAK